LDSADTGTIGNTDLDVSIDTPVGTPGVLDEEVFLSVFGTISDCEDSVVEGGSAGGGGEDTTGILLEDSLVGLDGDGNWALVEGGLELVWVLGLDGLVSGGTDGSLGFVVFAGAAIFGNVWVVGLGLEWGSLGVEEGKGHGTTIASMVQPGAVNELGLGEGDEVSGGNEVSTLQGTGGGESPAGTALSLVLDWSNCTSSNPVDLSGKVVDIELNLVNSLKSAILRGVLESVEALHLVLGEVGEFVDSDGGGLSVSGVVLLDGSQFLSELVKSELVLGLGSIGLAVLGHELHELSLGTRDDLGLVESGLLSRHVHEGDGGGETNGGDGGSDLLVHL